MGDRGNIVIKQDGGKGEIYLYSHWGGEELPKTLRAALVRGKGCWDDSPYLARIIFCEMVKGHEMSETGFGISTYECDNEHDLLIVDPDKQTVTAGAKTLTFLEFTDPGVPLPVI